ncbi:FRG domain-containing protein [Jiella marina]|uniref:FRG domain-containing protein n=1 Tax=Jiella sp. LLJ827 TaxID=2917712 RepID=UPI002100AFB6|nr:FRG domain-containing protein [Jiella sp. LLJ827]MCQ0987155.1 FRG domain-containing protein [Jiella sp. LLJ827]
MKLRIPARVKLRREARAKFSEFVGWAQGKSTHRWVFRGHANHWSLKPSVGRAKLSRIDYERQLLKDFQRGARPFLDETPENDWDWLAVAQHHGLPTRLLDWTTNPLVAAYFATAQIGKSRQSGEVIAVEARKVGFYHPEDPKEDNPFDISEARFIRPPTIAARIGSQRGLFSIHPEPEKPWYLTGKSERFEIAHGYKDEFRRSLHAMGVDDASLMADLDGLAKMLKWRFENRLLSE